MAALGAAGEPAEGRFFPDTYLYSRGVSDSTASGVKCGFSIRR